MQSIHMNRCFTLDKESKKVLSPEREALVISTPPKYDYSCQQLYTILYGIFEMALFCVFMSESITT